MSLVITEAHPSATRAVIATLIMVGATAAAWWLTPTRSWYDELGHPDLEQIVPRQFGDWVASDRTPVMLVDPGLSETLRITYAQTLTRVYLNRNSGRAIMLSIALGVDQSHATQLHHPEGCYRTQGFVVDGERYDVLNSPAGPVKLTRFTSHAQTRREPVSYWIRIGEWNTRSWSEKNWAKVAMAARGYKADGLLFRVSELSEDPISSFRMQDQFMDDLITAVSPRGRAILVGSLSL